MYGCTSKNGRPDTLAPRRHSRPRHDCRRRQAHRDHRNQGRRPGHPRRRKGPRRPSQPRMGGCRAGGRRRRHRLRPPPGVVAHGGRNRRHDERERTPPANLPRAHPVGDAPHPPGVCRCGPPPRSLRPASIPEVRGPARPRTRGPPPRIAHADRTRQRRTPTAAGPPTPPRAWCCGRSRPPSNG